MNKELLRKYKRSSFVSLPDRKWPSAHITKAPIWCSVDLRDGNQALATPMNIEEKLELYNTLLKVGFKQIEVGFPAASDTEYNFLRRLIEGNLVPEGVALQVLTQSKPAQIKRTFDALKGAKHAIVHLYNSTSVLQRKVTFKMSKAEIIDLAVNGVKIVKEYAKAAEKDGTKITLEYSPESFSDTEVEFALEICEAVKAVWQPTADNKIIINLPETVQYAMPNVYADQIEWVSRHILDRQNVLISVHTHNDRGTGVASTELGLLAGADRVEGTLFGNGERTGNLDIVNVALNMFAEGVDPELDFSNLPEIVQEYEKCTSMKVPPRLPYAGDLVFTAFSGSHQDAIKKGMDMRKRTGDENCAWEVPYLLIDPKDIGRDYEAIIRINSQSGKGGVAYILNADFGFDLPKAMHPEVGNYINAQADKLGKELSANEIYKLFCDRFVNLSSPIKLVSHKVEKLSDADSSNVNLCAKITVNGKEMEIAASGNGPINAFVNAMEKAGLKDFKVKDYRSHAIGSGSASNSAAYICIEKNSGGLFWACGVDPSIELAGLKALVSAVNLSCADK